MALKASEKLPMLPALERVPCAADAACKYTGRMWVRGLEPSARLCVQHYSQAIDEDRSLAKCEQPMKRPA